MVVGGARSGRCLEDVGAASVPATMAWWAWPLPRSQRGYHRNAVTVVFVQRPSNGDPASAVGSLECIDRFVSRCHAGEWGRLDCSHLRNARASDDDHPSRGSNSERRIHRATYGIRVRS